MSSATTPPGATRPGHLTLDAEALYAELLRGVRMLRESDTY